MLWEYVHVHTDKHILECGNIDIINRSHKQNNYVNIPYTYKSLGYVLIQNTCSYG